ncbi:proline--tRNA ligase [Gloeobacter violaceus]|uniref:Proline--tRNA ligase n=1 Tax=Gloeobacter violaceus (strain ATCC 29082 / PCC 7421) TaxID=251221 RepID=SYP_GLOVI|nr:proline--tRNA ligase [Gloeobacter violaceus]Q7NHL0.1 RecName: Full=Proline--tRNA ligase; AltName: Full=Prolyl-tRNA synthetase; Short=ProRS [Gloeobacter violaceus PCC 7421]BAC90466.1 prolyl-tRNA synthetase [Gloeobacter violaceus PCC 7421]
MTRLSSSFFFTLREAPAEAVAVSHKLLLRAGFIRPLAGTAGLYAYGPLMQRVLQKVGRIVREEMDATGAQEALFCQLQPAEIWKESGRWTVYTQDGTMFTLKDGQGEQAREYGLGPTHEEAVCDFVRASLNSYKQLPFHLYQVQTKFRNEKRPRFGLMRGREFIMKDGYSFHATPESLDETYRAMYRAYTNMFRRCGLDFRAVEADSGAIGGSGSHEFMALCDIGEDTILYCDAAGYAANVEKAVSLVSDPEAIGPGSYAVKSTPGIRTVEQQAAMLGVPISRIVKNIVYVALYAEADPRPVLVSIRGDRHINETKLKNRLDCLDVRLADEAELAAWVEVKPGFVGPDAPIAGVIRLADRSVDGLTDFSTGCNQDDVQCVWANWGENGLVLPEVADLDTAQAGDHCHLAPEATLQSARGVELGHIFKLGTKYSRPMQVLFADEAGELQPALMGCYGVGVSRLPAAVVEQSHDNDGILWPIAIAPYQVVLVPANVAVEAQRQAAEELYRSLTAAGIDTLLDDRPERAGVKFKDADLIGIPLRVTLGRDLEAGLVEIKVRGGGAAEKVPLAEALAQIKGLIERLNSAQHSR